VTDALQAYFAGELARLNDITCATAGTPFQRMVWGALRTIPPGRTLSYGALAARLDRPSAARAVGLANGANPISVVIPCHRLVGANGALTGYGGGLGRKRWLLAHEGA
jgi:methylated-DNA-[protein]-cysteine S-methyltransferase